MIKTFKIGEYAIGGIIRVEIPKAKRKFGKYRLWIGTQIT